MTIPSWVSLVTLGVADVERSTAFYRDLGWQRSSESNAEITFLRTQGAVVALLRRADLAADAGVPDTPEGGFRGVALAINVHTAEAVAKVLAEAERAGATAVKPATRAPWGGTSGYFADPDGHLWEVAHNPTLSLGVDGTILLPAN